MLVRNHTAINEALTITVLAGCHCSMTTTLTYLVGVYYGSLLPDIDHQYSPFLTTIDRLGFHRIYRWCCQHWQHRTITHTIYPLLLISLLIIGIWQFPLWRYCLIGLLIGYALHLYEDWWSLQSIPFFMPKPTHHPKHRYRVGGKGEAWLGFICRIWWYYLVYKIFC